MAVWQSVPQSMHHACRAVSHASGQAASQLTNQSASPAEPAPPASQSEAAHQPGQIITQMVK